MHMEPPFHANASKVQYSTTKERQRSATYWQFLFAWQMLDALFMYLSQPFFFFPINALMPLLVIIGLATTKIQKPIIKPTPLVLLVIFSVGYMLGAIDDANKPYDVFKQTITLTCAFIVGYQAIINQRNLRLLYTLFLSVGLAYGIICTLAILGLSNTYLPVIYDTGYDTDGTLIERARIMTNENYQIFYLFMIALCFSVKQSNFKSILTIIGLAVATFTMIKLQTRSGIILLLMTAFGGILLRMWYREKGALQSLAISAAIGLSLLLFKLHALQETASGLVHRFTDSGYGTFWGRIESFTYLFTMIYDPYYWYPRGEHIYMAAHNGTEAHNSLTMAFLNAGILGLIAWILLIIWPTCKGITKIIKRKVTQEHAGIIIGSTISFIAAFSLPAAQYEQVWLWAGACTAALLNRRPI